MRENPAVATAFGRLRLIAYVALIGSYLAGCSGGATHDVSNESIGGVPSATGSAGGGDAGGTTAAGRTGAGGADTAGGATANGVGGSHDDAGLPQETTGADAMAGFDADGRLPCPLD